MTAVVAMVFTAGAFACGSALVVLRDRAESPTDVSFADDFDRDDVGLATVHGQTAATAEITIETSNAQPIRAAVASSPDPLTAGLVEAPIAVEDHPTRNAAVEISDPVIAPTAIGEETDFTAAPETNIAPAARKNLFALLRMPRIASKLPARERRAPETKRGPMLRNILERFTRKPAAAAVDDEPLFTIEPNVAQRPYVEQAPQDVAAPTVAAGSQRAGEPLPPTPSFEAAAPVLASVPVQTHVVDEDDADDDLDSLVDDISPERRAELDRAAALAAQRSVAPEPSPEPAAIAQRAAETVHALAREAQAREANASRWANDLTGASEPVAIDKRRRLLKFYILSCDRPESRAILERVMREDPDLAGEAEAALNKAA